MVSLLVLALVVLAPAGDRASCPAPRITSLTAHSASADGYRIRVRVRAEVLRGGIGAFEVWWDSRSGLIADGWWPRRAVVKFEHRYRRRPGTHRITVVAEASTERCKRLQKSAPATLRVRVPLNPTNYLLSP